MSINLSFPEAYAAEKKSNYPPRVIGVKATSAGHDSIKLTWKKTSGAKGYKVYRSTKKNGRYKLIKTTKKIFFKNTGLTSNKSYYYKVKAYKTVKNKTYTSKKYSKTASAKPLLTKATSLKATEKSKSSITLSWKKGTNTKYYAIYRKEGKSGTYKKIKSTSKLSYTDKKLEAGKTYYYKVKAYNKRGDKRQYAFFSKYIKIKLSLPVSETTTEITATESTTAETTTTEETTTEPSAAETTTTEVITTAPVVETTTTEAPTTEPTTEALLSAKDYIKSENVEKAKAFADKLHAEAISDDYTKMCLPWEQMTRTTNWIYYTGLVFDAFLQTDFDKYHGFMKDFYNQYITDDGKIKTYCTGELDSAMLGAALVEILEKGDLTKTEKERYTNGICYIYNTLQKQTSYPQAGNLWLHSQNADGTPKTAWTKWNICLDGIYMSQIFLIRLTEAIDKGVVSILKADGSVVTSEGLWKDIYSRLSFAAENFKDEKNGLLYHGYCVETGETNKAFWSRGIGWYTMALVEAAEKMPDKKKREKLCGYFNSIMEGVVNHQDNATSLWYNVTDGKEECVFRQKKENGIIEIYNKPETSGSAMFSYCLLRGYNNDILKDEKFRISGLKAFNALAETKLTDEGLTDTITSCSVYTNKNNYMASDYTTNDGKGVGPFIMAANYVYEKPDPENSITKPSAEDYIKSENVEKAKSFADKLHTDAISDDYTKMCLPWEQMTRTTNWIYYTGLVFDAFLQTDFDKYHGFMKDFYNQYITDDGKIKTYAIGELDSAMLGAPLLEIMEKGSLTDAERARFNSGINYIYNQLQNQTIYPEAGNLWLHSQKADGTPRPAWVKWNICLDGIYMSQIFLIRLTEAIDKGAVSILKADGSVVTSEGLWKDIYSRLSFAAESFKDEETGLLYHGYCVETKENNGAFWSRGIGWFTMVLLEAAEKMPDKEKREKLCGYFNSIMDAVVRYQDEASSLWYNVTDGKEEYFYTKKADTGEETIYNIPETSGSAMFTYCLLRGYKSGILRDEKFRISGLKGFNALVEDKLCDEGLKDVYTSSSVTSNKNLYQKNGYTTNDGKGVGPFIMAANYVY